VTDRMHPFKATKITDNVHWVGAIDWRIRNFHGYSTDRGTTYNAYLILADKVTLVDTVKAPFLHEVLSRIACVRDPSKRDYRVSNHAEMDHSGALPSTISIVQPGKVFASANGVMALGGHFNILQEITPVKDGETIDLGRMSITFMETKMLHWPDSMFSYLAEDKLLFSQDGFGMHLASTERFDDELDEHVLIREAAKYFANILLPYSKFVTKLLDKVSEMQLEFDLIAPDHGPVWRRGVGEILRLWGEWALQRPQAKAVVVYDTMWQSTDVMARAIADGLAEGGVSTSIMPLGASHRSDVATELLDAGALVVGSPTLNNMIYPTVADVLTYLEGLRPTNLIGGVFSSYGWSASAFKQLRQHLEDMNVELVTDGVNVQYVPKDGDLGACREMGLQIATELRKRLTG